MALFLRDPSESGNEVGDEVAPVRHHGIMVYLVYTPCNTFNRSRSLLNRSGLVT